MKCSIQKENEELKKEIRKLKKNHLEDIDKIRQMLTERGNNGLNAIPKPAKRRT